MAKDMSRNSNKNKEVIKELEKTISPVLVVNNSSLKPYVELFEYSPENIYQQPLGSLVGFFEIKDYSEESAYIVNFLTSVLKKEYYINPKRPVTESLDSALHKVNMALSELVKHGNVEWLGKINAAICVLEKNNAHFSVSGNAKIFLYRNQALSEISEDLASDSLEPHPLKTFVNVSSGRLEKNDRLLITSEDIFHILPVTEIKKNFQRFEGDKFVQFLRTALSNQMEMLASVVVEMVEAAPAVATKTLPRKKTTRMANVFSEKTFANSMSEEIIPEDEHSDEIIEEANYTDKKTGHIYIQGETNDIIKTANPQINIYKDLVKEKISQGIFLTKNEIRKRISLYKKQSAKKKELRQAEKEKRKQIMEEEAKRIEEQRVLEEIEIQHRLAEEKELERVRLEQEKIIAEQELAERMQLEQQQRKLEEKQQQQQQHKAITPEENKELKLKNYELSFKEKLERAKLEYQRSISMDVKKQEEKSNLEDMEDDFEEFEEEDGDEYFEEPKNKTTSNTISKLQAIKSYASNLNEKIAPILRHAKESTSTSKLLEKINGQETEASTNKQKFTIAPHFSKIKQLFSQFNNKQKVYILVAMILIFIVPIFIVRFLNTPKPSITSDLPATIPSQSEILANEKNIRLKVDTQKVSSTENIVTTLIANDEATLITKSSIAIIQNGETKEFPLPADSGTPIRAAYMNDLSLVFVLTDTDKVISFSPISKKFIDNKINLAGVTSTNFIGTYLTYLYLLDSKTNQIYRFPRADGGFGEKTSWLKDSTSLSETSDMTIDDNIFVVSNNQVLKLFKGQKQDFTLETSTTPINFDKIYTTPELQSLYALDIKNSRLVQYSKDGKILAQFHNETFKDASSLAVNEKNKTAYVAVPSGLISISIQ
ncbi:MAG: hypothetical protein ACD_9C00158G0007 [uncultured bacterium]|nr:MAG: hypothetical protein ACD_9C00158G0007 [uncultured bacterium]